MSRVPVREDFRCQKTHNFFYFFQCQLASESLMSYTERKQLILLIFLVKYLALL